MSSRFVNYQTSSSEALGSALNHTLLSVDDENRLLSLAKEGDREAISELVEHNQKLVASVAKMYLGYGNNSVLEFVDLIQIGNLGLCKAIELWDPTKGVRFSTYAFYWIKSFIGRNVIYHAQSLTVSYRFSEILVKLRRVRSDLASKLRREPTQQELAEASGLPLHKVQLGLTAIASTVSLHENWTSPDDETKNTGGAPELYIADPSQNTEDQVVDKLMFQYYKDFITKRFSERQVQVFTLLYGLDGCGYHSIAEVAKLLEITRQRVYEIQKYMLKVLRDEFVRRSDLK